MTQTKSSYSRPWAIAFTCIALVLSAWSHAGGPQWLQIESKNIQGNLTDHPLAIPVYVRSEEQKDLLNAEVYGVVDHPLAALAKTLAIPANWCEFGTLHPNIRACTHKRHGTEVLLTVYIGRKSLESPRHASKLELLYQLVHLGDENFKVSLEGHDGPMGTRDHRFALEAMRVGDKTLVRVQFSYRIGFMSRLAAKAYLATRGAGRIGFSTVGVNDAGDPIYVKGTKGMIERSVMRFYLALLALMETRHLPALDQIEARINHWVSLAQRYPPQLGKLEREEYVQLKRRDWANQLKLQSALVVGSEQGGGLSEHAVARRR
ncbi:MAG: hypothetical protein ACE5K1_07210 [Acidiferrobacterales bacterium]